MKKFTKTPLAVTMGTAVLSGVAAGAHADSNPFALTELTEGYMQVAAGYNAKDAHGACGSNAMDSNGNKVADSKGGAKKEAGKHAPAAKKAEGSCGEGMCGGMMSGGKMKPGMEHSCGAMMKGHEGSCGMMSMGGMDHGDGNKADKPKSEEGSCGAMMKGGEGSCGGMMKGGEGSCGGMMKGGEGSCGSKTDADKGAGH